MMTNKLLYACLFAASGILSACSTQQQITKKASRSFIKDPVLKDAHIGILIQDAEHTSSKYSYQSNKLFTPASNLKIVSCYAAMKHLPNQLPAAVITDTDTAVVITPTGDPTFLHPDFQRHPFFETLRSINKPLYITDNNWHSPAFGP